MKIIVITLTTDIFNRKLATALARDSSSVATAINARKNITGFRSQVSSSIKFIQLNTSQVIINLFINYNFAFVNTKNLFDYHWIFKRYNNVTNHWNEDFRKNSFWCESNTFCIVGSWTCYPCYQFISFCTKTLK